MIPMSVDQCPACQNDVSRLGQLLADTSVQLRRAHTLFDRVSDSLAVAGEMDAEDGWRFFN